MSLTLSGASLCSALTLRIETGTTLLDDNGKTAIETLNTYPLWFSESTAKILPYGCTYKSVYWECSIYHSLHPILAENVRDWTFREHHLE